VLAPPNEHSSTANLALDGGIRREVATREKPRPIFSRSNAGSMPCAFKSFNPPEMLSALFGQQEK
jgi:hypothetical protein